MRLSRTKLVDDLMKQHAGPNRDRMVQKAKAGHYHPETAIGNGKRQCAADLRKARFNDLAVKVEAGDYD